MLWDNKTLITMHTAISTDIITDIIIIIHIITVTATDILRIKMNKAVK